MDLDDISPAAVILALVGAVVTIIMFKIAGASGKVEIGFIWKILTPVLTFIACFFLVQRMAE